MIRRGLGGCLGVALSWRRAVIGAGMAHDGNRRGGVAGRAGPGALGLLLSQPRHPEQRNRVRIRWRALRLANHAASPAPQIHMAGKQAC